MNGLGQADQGDQGLASRAAEVDHILTRVQPLLLSFISQAERDDFRPTHQADGDALIDHRNPHSLSHVLDLTLPRDGKGTHGVLDMTRRLLQCSTNTWHQGFMDKLYASTNAVGVASELVLAVLNTNVHVYKVSPALTVIEKQVSKALAHLFGLNGPGAGGIVQSGGSSANLTALVVARNCLFPHVKQQGCQAQSLVLFSSKHAHYSLEKAASVCGLGSAALWKVPVDSQGRMLPSDLAACIAKARSQGLVPFFVNATAGTTVLGSYDPLPEIGAICKREELWFHVDASWGGPAIFSPSLAPKLEGTHLADSITVNPHKMMGVPITCSFLLGQDMNSFWKSNTLPANYLFHTEQEDGKKAAGVDQGEPDIWDLADLTLQCGRKGDALKLAMAWVYYGSDGFRSRIERAFSVAVHLADLVQSKKDLVLVSENPPPCLQVCFYYAPDGCNLSSEATSEETRRVVEELMKRRFLIDYASGINGFFFRVVVSLETRCETVEELIGQILEVGAQGRERARELA